MAKNVFQIAFYENFERCLFLEIFLTLIFFSKKISVFQENSYSNNKNVDECGPSTLGPINICTAIFDTQGAFKNCIFNV